MKISGKSYLFGSCHKDLEVVAKKAVAPLIETESQSHVIVAPPVDSVKAELKNYSGLGQGSVEIGFRLEDKGLLGADSKPWGRLELLPMGEFSR